MTVTVTALIEVVTICNLQFDSDSHWIVNFSHKCHKEYACNYSIGDTNNDHNRNLNVTVIVTATATKTRKI